MGTDTASKENWDGWGVAVLAAGKGLRMESSLPKVLHPVCGKPMIGHVVQSVRDVATCPVVVIVPSDSEAIRNYLGDSVEYAVQTKPKGTGHAVLQAEGALHHRCNNVLVLCGDAPLVMSSTIAKLMSQHNTSAATLTMLTSTRVPSDGLGRVVRDAGNRVIGVVEHTDATEAQRAIPEINSGVYAFRSDWLWPALAELSPSAKGEYYLTDLVKMASSAGLTVESIQSEDELEVLGVNNRVQLSQAEQAMRQRILKRWMLSGVTMIDPATTYINADVTLGRDTVLYPSTTVAGKSSIGERCSIGPGAMIYDSVIGNDCKVMSSMLEGARVGSSVDIGPFSHLRPGTVIEDNVHIGNYGEVKNSRLGSGTQMGHFSYVGDADVGRNVNIGAGTITCNFDGVNKNRTIIEDGVFIGSDTMLVAPVKVGTRSSTGAGAVVTKDVPPDTIVVGVPARAIAHKRRVPEQ